MATHEHESQAHDDDAANHQNKPLNKHKSELLNTSSSAQGATNKAHTASRRTVISMNLDEPGEIQGKIADKVGDFRRNERKSVEPRFSSFVVSFTHFKSVAYFMIAQTSLRQLVQRIVSAIFTDSTIQQK